MRKYAIFILFLSLILFCPGLAIASGKQEYGRTKPEPFFELALAYAPVNGSFEMNGGPPNGAPATWKISHPLDGSGLTARSTLRLHPRFSLDLIVGYTDLKDGEVTDRDRDGEGVTSDLSYSTSLGTLTSISSNLNYTAVEAKRASLELSLGYFYQIHTVEYRDPTLKIVDYEPKDLSWEEKWLVYDLDLSGVRFALSGVANLSRAVSLNVTLGMVPWLNASYDGLRYPERPFLDQQEEKIEAGGYGVDALIGLAYKHDSGFSATLGYSYFYAQADGTDSAGTFWAGSREELTIQMYGPLVQVSYGLTLF